MHEYSFSDSDSDSMSGSYSSFASLGVQPSILVVGASCRTGIETIHQLYNHPSRPEIHAFCEELVDLPRHVAKLCTSVTDGDVRHAIDIVEALRLTKANWIVLAGDISEDQAQALRRNDIRTAAAQNTARVLRFPEFQHVRALAVSRIGVASSKVRMGVMGKLSHLKFRRVLKDYSGQEKELFAIQDRSIVLRTTPLRDGESSQSILELVDKDTVPTCSMSRADLAACIVDEILGKPLPEHGRVVNLTSA